MNSDKNTVRLLGAAFLFVFVASISGRMVPWLTGHSLQLLCCSDFSDSADEAIRSGGMRYNEE